MMSKKQVGTFLLAFGLPFSVLVFSPTHAQEPPNTTATENTESAEEGFIDGILKLIQGVLEEEEAPLIQEGPPPLLTPVYLPLGTFVVNLREGKFFLKTTITLVFANSQPQLWLEKRLPLVKDLLITQLGRLSVRRLRDVRFRQQLKNDLRVRINSLFPNNVSWDDARPLKKILFEEFYTQ